MSGERMYVSSQFLVIVRHDISVTINAYAFQIMFKFIFNFFLLFKILICYILRIILNVLKNLFKYGFILLCDWSITSWNGFTHQKENILFLFHSNFEKKTLYSKMEWSVNSKYYWFFYFLRIYIYLWFFFRSTEKNTIKWIRFQNKNLGITMFKTSQK